MKVKKYSTILMLFFALTAINSQSKKDFIKISGVVTDLENNPIKDAIIFIDSVKTKVKTNKKGLYKIKISPRTSEVAIFVDQLGLLTKKYTGEKIISFVFRTDKNADFQEDMIIAMGYKLETKKTFDNHKIGRNYSDYGSVYEVLDKLFPFVKVRNGNIKIGNGPSTFSGDDTPLIFIDDQRTTIQAMAVLSTNDIKEIKVIRRGSEAAVYGALAASNGVILIDLKTGK